MTIYRKCDIKICPNVRDKSIHTENRGKQKGKGLPMPKKKNSTNHCASKSDWENELSNLERTMTEAVGGPNHPQRFRNFRLLAWVSEDLNSAKALYIQGNLNAAVEAIRVLIENIVSAQKNYFCGSAEKYFRPALERLTKKVAPPPLSGSGVTAALKALRTEVEAVEKMAKPGVQDLNLDSATKAYQKTCQALDVAERHIDESIAEDKAAKAAAETKRLADELAAARAKREDEMDALDMRFAKLLSA